MEDVAEGKYTGKRQCRKCGGLTFKEGQIAACGPRERCSSCGFSVWDHKAFVAPDFELMNAGRR